MGLVRMKDTVKRNNWKREETERCETKIKRAESLHLYKNSYMHFGPLNFVPPLEVEHDKRQQQQQQLF